MVHDRLRLLEPPIQTRTDGPNSRGEYRVTFTDRRDWFVQTIIGRQGRVTAVQGTNLGIMPWTSRRTAPFASPWQLILLMCAFLACGLVRGPGARQVNAGIGLLAAAGVITQVSAWIRPAYDHDAIVRTNVAVLLTVTLVVLAAVAWSLVRARASNVMDTDSAESAASRRRWRPILPWPVLAAATVLAVALTFVILFREPTITDAGRGGASGATLMRAGVLPYGNLSPVAGFFEGGDGYGPLTYAAYIPATYIADPYDFVRIGQLSSAGFQLLCLAALGVLGFRARRLPGAMWAMAIWATNPVIVFDTILGFNDQLTTAALLWTAVAMSSPKLRGLVFSLGIWAKFFPIVALPALLRMRGEGWRAMASVAGMFVGLTLLLGVYVAHPKHGWHLFVQSIVHGPGATSDAGSLWGVTGWHWGPYIPLAAMTALALWSLRGGRTHASALYMVAATIGLGSISGGHWGMGYLTWTIAPLLAAIIVEAYPIAEVTQAEDPAPVETAPT